MSDLKKISIQIAGKGFPIKVTSEEEAFVRDIEKEINHKINQFQINYANQDKVDYLSMTLLTYAFDLFKAKKSNNDSRALERLSDLEKSLDQYI